MDRAIVRCAERTSMVSRLDTAADRNAITAFKPVIWSVPWSLVGKRRECMSDGCWCEPQAPSISEPPRGGYKALAIGIVPPCLAAMAIVMDREGGIPPWAKATGLPAAVSVKMPPWHPCRKTGAKFLFYERCLQIFYILLMFF